MEIVSVVAFFVVCALILAGVIFLLKTEGAMTASYKNAGVYGRVRAALFLFLCLGGLSAFVKPLYYGIITALLLVFAVFALPVCFLWVVIGIISQSPAPVVVVDWLESVFVVFHAGNSVRTTVDILASLIIDRWMPFDWKHRLLMFIICGLLALFLYISIKKKCPTDNFLLLKLLCSGVCAIPRFLFWTLCYTVAIIAGVFNLFVFLCIIAAEAVFAFVGFSIISDIFHYDDRY
ncbi:MAG: hypothetical protein IJK52_03065 [Oscillospiraceae bacterium]|nr:hypothetical protein [Oscillospiraceae bacterium]